MSCLKVDLRLLSKPLKVTANRVGRGLTATANIVCSVGYDDGREIFMVKEGIFLLADGQMFRVIRSNE